MANFPASADNLPTNITPSTPETGVHATLHNNTSDAVNAVEAALLPGGSIATTIAGKAPTVHTHVEGDIVDATATPTGSKIPIANSSGLLDGWISAASTSIAGRVQLATSGATTAGLAVQASDTRLGRTTVIPAVFKATGGIATGTYTLVRIPSDRAGTVQKIQAIALGGTSVAFNFRKNGATLLHTGDITVTSGSGYLAVTTSLINTSILADDYIELLVNTVTGTVTDLTVQIEIK